MKVAYIAHANANGYYRGIGPMSALAERGHDIVPLPPRDPRGRLRGLAGADVLFLHRYADGPTLELVRAAKRTGVAVVWDDDDDGAALPRDDPLYPKLGGVHWQRRLTTMKRIFALADLVTAPSEHLAARFREDGAQRTRVVENFVADEFARTAPTSHDGIVIGWVAGREHRVDATTLGLAETIGAVLEARQHVSAVTVGVKLTLAHRRYLHVPPVHIADLPAQIAGWDVALAPLADVPFNRARSNVKLKEYAAVGVPWLASPIGPYAGLGEKQGGRLVQDADWERALIDLVDAARARRKLAKRAARWGGSQTLEAHAGQWEQALEAAVSHARSTAALPA